jgi:trehalose synthase
VWRCHIDTSEPNPATWAFLRPFLEGYDAAVFTMTQFVPKDMPAMPVVAIPPAIDPLSPKNLPLPTATAEQLLEWVGVRPTEPLMTQVARFDPWKDPLGVIDAYRLVRDHVPGLQLVLAGSMALDDPEGWQVYERIRAESVRDPLIHVLSNLTGVGNVEVNALQRCSDVVVQKSVREGFGLVVSEALWKGTPVVAGRAGGIPLQMADGVGGYLVDDVQGCAAAVLRLLRDRPLARALGHRGRERVRRHFLLPRLLLNELSLLTELSGAVRPSRLGWATHRDPVCGLVLDGVPQEHVVHAEQSPFGFCSEACRSRFLEEPQRWLPELRAGPV